jgi:hypothetical protein
VRHRAPTFNVVATPALGRPVSAALLWIQSTKPCGRRYRVPSGRPRLKQTRRIAVRTARRTYDPVLQVIALARRNRARPRPGMNGPGTSITRSSGAYFALSTASH